MDLTKAGLTEYLLKLSKSDGYTALKPYLNRILKEADLQEIPKNEIYLIVYHICKEHKTRFWNEYHRREITNWLKDSRIIDLSGNFDTIWAEEEVYSIDELTEANPDIASLNEQILLNGSKSIKVQDKFFKVYSAQLYFILTQIINAKKVGSQEDVLLNGREYLMTYIKAYREGEAYFKSHHEAGVDIIYNNDKSYIKSLHYNFFHAPLPQQKIGWSWIKESYPFIISHKGIKEFGYYAGLVSEVEELKEKHPAPFVDFDRCEESQGSQQTETKTEQEQQSENDFTLSTIEDWLFEFKEKMSEADYNSLVAALMHRFDTGIFPILSKPIKINGKPNKKLFGWALNRIFAEKGKRVEKELLMFAKKNISLFADVGFDENNILKSNLYKYFTTKTR